MVFWKIKINIWDSQVIIIKVEVQVIHKKIPGCNKPGGKI